MCFVAESLLGCVFYITGNMFLNNLMEKESLANGYISYLATVICIRFTAASLIIKVY